MKSIQYLVVGLLTMFLFLACGSDSSLDPVPTPEPPVVEEPDELEFKVLVYIDKPSVEGHLGGSERVVRNKMDKLFREATTYWNASSKGKLKYSYHYSVADMKIYDGSSSDATLRKQIYNDPIDFTKYDVTVFFDCLQDNGETGNGGAAHGGGSDNRSVVTVFAGSTPKDIFSDATYRTLVHELGHYRGVTDLYQYIIAAKDNPVSGQAFDGPACIMNWAAAGAWSDYAANCMNLSAGSKQIGKDFPDFFGSLYPKNMEITVTVSGTPKRGVSVRLYGSRAGSSSHDRDIWPEVFVSGQTNSEGKFIVRDLKKHFIPSRTEFQNVPADLPYGRWFGFLAEITNGSLKKYVWMPEYEVQMPTFEGKDIYEVKVAF